MLLALLLTALNYLVLTGYDQLAVAYAGLRLHRGRVALAGFVSYAISNSLGFGMLSGAAVRFRFYTRWGVGALELSRIVLFQSTTFWLGLLVLGGATLGFAPHPWLRDLPAAPLVRALGLALLGLGLAYAVLPLVRRAPLRLGRFEVPVPTARLAAGQFVLSILDWGLAAAVLQALLPPGAVPFGELLGAFLAAQIVGLVSHVPGGLGVFETLMVLALKPYLPATSVLPALVLYRAVYYLLPLAAALALLVADEVSERRAQIAWLGGALGTVTRAVAPRLLAAFTFLAGAVLLFSGATPSAPGRVAWLSDFLPLPLLEVSHFLGSLVGVGLLVVSRGVWRRLDAAYYLAALGLVLGIVASLLKGGDYEEAALLGFVLLAFAPSRPAFDRRVAFFDGRLAPGWALAILSVVGASVWLGLFSFKHVEYSHDLWWRFELEQDALALPACLGRRHGGAPRLRRHPAVAPGAAGGEAARPTRSSRRPSASISAQSSTLPFLAFMRDKALLFDESRTGFLMYGVRGRTWVALGDPVGPEGFAPTSSGASWSAATTTRGVPIFYQVGKDALHLYADFGLDVRQARRGGAGPPARLFAGGRGAQALPQRPATAGAGRRERSASSPARRWPRTRARSGRSRTTGSRGGEPREGLLAGLLPAGVRAPLPSGRHREGRADHRLCDPLAGTGEGGALRGPHAAPRVGPEERDGGALRAPHALGGRSRATSGSTWAWRRSRASRPRRWRRCGRGSGGSSTGAARPSTTSRACARSRRSSIPSGSRATWLTPAGSPFPA